METLTALILGSAVTIITQLWKKSFPKINPLFIVGFIAIIVGIAFSFVKPMIPVETMEKIIQGFAYAVAIYEVACKVAK